MRHTLWQSFRFASRGLQTAFWSQRTMRVHIAIAALVTVAAVWLDLPAGEAAALVIAMVVVLAAELFNTAAEALVDLVVGDRHHGLAGRAKDLSAAAVLVAAAGAAIVGLLVLGRPILAAFGGGGVDALLLARACVFLLVFALVAVVLRRPGAHPPENGGPQ